MSRLIFDFAHTSFDNEMKIELIKKTKTKLLLNLFSHYERLLLRINTYVNFKQFDGQTVLL
jgi:hypothetical protein